MPKTTDSGTTVATEVAEVRTYTQEEVDALLSQDRAGNPTPAVEEGPHLRDPEKAEAKRKQLHEAGMTVDDETLPADMRRLLSEEG